MELRQDASSDGHVQLWAKIQKDSDGYPESQDWEDLWAWALPNGNFQLDSIPFFVKDLALEDVISAAEHDGQLILNAVVERSGHSTFRIWLHDQCAIPTAQIISELKQLGANVEITLTKLIAVDAPAEYENVIWEYLDGGRDRDDWEIQVGHSPD